MRNNKIFKAMAVAAPVLLSANVMANTIAANFEFGTVANVQVSESQVVQFGASIIPITGRSCTLTPTITTTGVTTATVVATGAVAGDGCDNAAVDALPGEYPITGAASSQITITLTASDVVATPDYQYTPSGDFMNGTVVTPVDTIAPLTATLDAAGLGYMVLGGTLDILTNATGFSLTAQGTDYQIEVTY